jgi:hypothetical protein
MHKNGSVAHANGAKEQEVRGPDDIFDTMDLRKSLIQAYRDLKADRITPNKARAISQMARAITDTLRLEVQAARESIGSTKPIMMMPRNVGQSAIEDKSERDE